MFSLDFIFGFIIGISIVTSIKSIIKKNKILGIIELVLTIFIPIVVEVWATNKNNFVYGGSDIEFLLHSAFIDKMIEPIIIIVLFILLFILIIYNIIKSFKLS